MLLYSTYLSLICRPSRESQSHILLALSVQTELNLPQRRMEGIHKALQHINTQYNIIYCALPTMIHYAELPLAVIRRVELGTSHKECYSYTHFQVWLKTTNYKSISIELNAYIKFW